MLGTPDTMPMPRLSNKQIDTMTVTPAIATELLERNTINRPLSDAHVHRIAKQIMEGKWKFNGDTIKVAETNDILDGQHRLWAIIEARQPVETIIVYGIERDAFATIDTLRKPRSGGDVVALNGASRYRTIIAGALSWLLRWQRGVLERYRAPENRIENSDIEAAFQAHQKGIERAVERAVQIKGVAPPSLLAFVFYIASNQNQELAEQMMAVLENPARTATDHPFFRLRDHFVNTKTNKKRDPLVSIALCFKALNAAAQGKSVQNLIWKNQGSKPEEFPTLNAMPKKVPSKQKEAA